MDQDLKKNHLENGNSIKGTTDDESKEHNNSAKNILKTVLKIAGLIGCLYFFIVSLNLMSTSFPLIGGRYASEAFRSNVVLTNPVAGIMIGLLSTVIVQSSSTSTSIIVSLVASEIIQVRYAIPLIMGSNIGTSITSTLVALSQAADKEKFRLSFAGATIHDMFNILTVIVLLPVELLFGYLEHFSGVLVHPLHSSSGSNKKEPELLSALTKPLNNFIIQIDKEILDYIAINKSFEHVSLIKRHCKGKNPLIQQFISNSTMDFNVTHSWDNSCFFIFKNVLWSDWVIGLILLAVSLVGLCSCLVGMVKILGSIFNGPVAKIIQKTVNSDFPGVFRYFTSIVAILLGCILTIVVQSSSVFTSTLTPLVGMGIVTVERVFPLTLGSNIGTTITGILAALSGPAKTLEHSLQIALCHSLFNVSGILIWYPIPFLRRVPIRMAKFLGDTTAEYRWFAILYLIGLFVLIPITVFFLSMLGKVVFITVLIIIIAVIAFVSIVNLLQNYKVEYLPEKLRNWNWLPLALRSLEPYDKLIVNYLCCCKACRKLIEPKPETDINMKSNGDLNNHSNGHLPYHSNKAFEIETF